MKSNFYRIVSAMYNPRAGKFIGNHTPTSNEWKPEFTDTELQEVRFLPKKQREQRVEELRAKYWSFERK